MRAMIFMRGARRVVGGCKDCNGGKDVPFAAWRRLSWRDARLWFSADSSNCRRCADDQAGDGQYRRVSAAGGAAISAAGLRAAVAAVGVEGSQGDAAD